LVPLSNRGFVRRENVIPYIMGANITTFMDTLLAAILLCAPAAAAAIIVAGMGSISLISIFILIFAYRRFERAMLDFVDLITDNNRNLAIFMLCIFVAPIVLMLI